MTNDQQVDAELDETAMSFRLDRSLYQRLVALADRNERSISGEARLALRLHVEARERELAA